MSISPCLILLCSNTWPKTPCRRKGLIGLHVTVTVHHWGKSAQKLKVRTYSQGLKQRPWRSSSYRLVHHAFFSPLSYMAQDNLPKGWHYPQWAGSSYIYHQSENVWRQSDGSRGSFFPYDSTLHQVGKKKAYLEHPKNLCWIQQSLASLFVQGCTVAHKRMYKWLYTFVETYTNK